MRLADLRKLAIREQYGIRFRLTNGMECVVTEHGIAEVPGLKGVPGFNLEEELASAEKFVLEPCALGREKKAVPQPRSISREDLAAMVKSLSPAAAAHPEEE